MPWEYQHEVWLQSASLVPKIHKITLPTVKFGYALCRLYANHTFTKKIHTDSPDRETTTLLPKPTGGMSYPQAHSRKRNFSKEKK